MAHHQPNYLVLKLSYGYSAASTVQKILRQLTYQWFQNGENYRRKHLADV
jgi:hypothetical protein